VLVWISASQPVGLDGAVLIDAILPKAEDSCD